MPLWRVRDFHDDDLDAAVRMWDDPSTGGTEPVFGLSELIAAVRAGEPAVAAFVGVEPHARGGVFVYDKLEPLAPDDFGVLNRLGGRMLRADAWERLGGMVQEKQLIERRIILPLAGQSWPRATAWSRRAPSCSSGPREPG